MLGELEALQPKKDPRGASVGRGGGSERFRGAQGARPSPSGLGFGAQKRGGSSCVCVPSAPRWVWGTQGCGEGVRASLTEPPPTAIGGALRQHPAGPHPDQGQLCGPGGHRGNQGHLPQVPEQVGESTAAFLEAFVCFIITVQQCKPQSA